MKKSSKITGRRRNSSGCAKSRQNNTNCLIQDENKSHEVSIPDDFIPNAVVSHSEISDANCQQNAPSTTAAVVSVADQSSCEIVISGPVATRCSGRILKRVKRDISPPHSPVKKAKDDKVLTPAPKQRRTWDLWSGKDADMFFEGLYQFGKNFEEIWKYIMQRYKRKGDAAQVVRNKDQVRHFYYRTWNKISKYVKMAENISKKTKELYGLINYGELRKKFKGRLDDKIGQKLNELIQNGYVVIKWNKKNLKLKTPCCRALKKLNNIEDPKDIYELPQPKIPAKVIVELIPRNIKTWTTIQNMAQNPRVKVNISTERKLGSIMEFLEKKWKPQSAKIKEAVKIPAEESIKRALKVYPSPNCPVVAVLLKKQPAPERINLAFQNHKESLLLRGKKLNDTLNVNKRDIDDRQTCLTEINSQAPSVENSQDSGQTSIDKSQSSYSENLNSTHENTVVSSSQIETAMDIQTITEHASIQKNKTFSHESVVKNGAINIYENEASVTEMLQSMANSCVGNITPVKRLVSVNGEKSNTDIDKFGENTCRTSPTELKLNCFEDKQLGGIGSPSQGFKGLITSQAIKSFSCDYESGNSNAFQQNPMTGLMQCHIAASQLIFTKTEGSMPDIDDNKESDIMQDLNVPKSVESAIIEGHRSESSLDAKSDCELFSPEKLHPVSFVKNGAVENISKVNHDLPNRVHNGWSAEEAGKITIAELLLIVGCPEKIVLEYEWVEPSSCSVINKLSSMLQRLVTLASTEFTDLKKPRQSMSTSSPCRCRNKKTCVETPPGKSCNPSLANSPLGDISPAHRKRRGSNKAERPKENVEILPKPIALVTPLGVQMTAQQHQMKEPLPPNPDSIVWKRLKRSVRKPMVISNPRNILPKAASSGGQMLTAVKIMPSQGRGSGTFVPIIPNTSVSMATMNTSRRPLLTARRIVPGPTHQSIPPQQGVIKVSPGSYKNISTSASVKPLTVCRNSPLTVHDQIVEVPNVHIPTNSPSTQKSGLHGLLGTNSVKLETVGSSLLSNHSSSLTPNSSIPGPSSLGTHSSGCDISFPQSQFNILSSSHGNSTEIINQVASLSRESQPQSFDSTFLDVSLPPTEVSNDDANSMSDKLIDLALGRASLGELCRINASSKSTHNEGLKTPIGSPTRSPFKTGNTDAWLSNEVGDMSLSCLFDSPLKKAGDYTQQSMIIPFNLQCDSSRDSINLNKMDVDTQLQCMLNENSIDYVAKFQELAAQIAADEKKAADVT